MNPYNLINLNALIKAKSQRGRLTVTGYRHTSRLLSQVLLQCLCECGNRHEICWRDFARLAADTLNCGKCIKSVLESNSEKMTLNPVFKTPKNSNPGIRVQKAIEFYQELSNAKKELVRISLSRRRYIPRTDKDIDEPISCIAYMETCFIEAVEEAINTPEEKIAEAIKYYEERARMAYSRNYSQYSQVSR